MVKDWAKQVIQRKALVLDIESTGGSFSDEVIDLAVIDLESLSVLYSSLLKPTAPINYHAQRVHGITHEVLRYAPYLEDEFLLINSILEDKLVITYNVSFDSRIFNQSYDKYLLKTPRVEWECLMDVCTKHFGKQLKLDYVCNILNLKKGNHRAEPDALAASHVIHSLACD